MCVMSFAVILLVALSVGGTALADGSGLSAWWKFDGDYTDSSGNGLNGTAQGTGNSFDTTNVKQGTSSLSMTGSGYVTYGNNLNLAASDPLTISLWMKRGSTVGAGTLVAKQVDWDPHTNKGWILINNGPDGIYWQMNAGTGFRNNELQMNWFNLPINDGNWHHIAFTKSSSSAASGVTFYVDGVALPPSNVDSDTLTQDPTNTTDLSVGGEATGIHGFIGDIDSVKIEKRQWSSLEVQNEFNNPSGSTLGELAAARARSLVGKPYFEGGKGYDMATKKYNPPFPYVGVDTISSGYTHCTITGCPPKISTDTTKPGIDCAGLVLWSYNTAAGSSKTSSSDPIPRPNDEGAYDQFKNSTHFSDPGKLQPGDLLFFKYTNAAPVTHVAMYVGPTDNFNEGAVVEAYSDQPDPKSGKPIGVIESACEVLAQTSTCTRAQKDPEFGDDLNCSKVQVLPCFVTYGRPLLSPPFGIGIRLHSPATLTVTDPDGNTITTDTLFVSEREVLREVPGELYYSADSQNGDEVIGRVLKSGNYFIQVVPKPDASSSDTYSLTVTAAGSTITLAENIPINQIPPLGYGIQWDGSAIAPFIPVAIDIKPGSTPNPINPGSQGTVPVAILSNSTFDARSQIYVNSLTFGRTGTESSLAFCDSGGEDVNGDGLLDLVCHFYTQKTGFQIGDIQGVLKGLTSDGDLIRGTDSVQIVPQLRRSP